MSVRTRFAPSPTGRLHAGNVRTAVFNWLLARRHGGRFIVRIEDTDAARTVPGAEAALLEDLRWLGLAWDEGPDVGGPHAPYRQSERGAHYDRAIAGLVEAGAAYPCYCTEEEVAARAGVRGAERDVVRYDGRCRRPDAGRRSARGNDEHVPAIRFAVPEGCVDIDVEDEVYGHITVSTNDIDDFILRRADGRVTYNFGVVADDVDMDVSHVIRGVGHLSNTPRQALLFDALGAPRPVFAHLPTVLTPEGEKLSKRHGGAAVAELRASGYPPDAVLNYLSLLGWSHPDGDEVLRRDELVRSVSLDRVGRSDTRLDPEKLRWMAARHIAVEDAELLAEHVEPFVDPSRFPEALARPVEVVEALRSRLSTYGEIGDHLPALFPEDDGELARLRSELAAEPRTRATIAAVLARLTEVEEWTATSLDAAVRQGGKDAGARGPELFRPVRLALTGVAEGPELGKVLAALGPDEASRRLGAATTADEALSDL